MEISYDVLLAISEDLQAAAGGLADSAASAPTAVDAGVLTPLVTEPLALLLQSAAGVADRLGQVSGAVTAHVADLRRTDGDVAGWFRWVGQS